MDEFARFGSETRTSITLPAIVIIVIAGLLILFLRRKYTAVPYLLAAVLLPQQGITAAGINITTLRLLAIFCVIRICYWLLFGTRETWIRMNPVDWLMVLTCLSSSVALIGLWQDWGAVVNRVGFAYD